ncbi:unnamed protein product [Owenia fusiformis]|uniref:EF-hand domain-containing protein n=1 Tax=Owenia fusiformis TaxID=6347 RepID=A0A8S4Q7L0_OWEFU|nr:unnamed protein product [Owenia fusiformis]
MNSKIRARSAKTKTTITKTNAATESNNDNIVFSYTKSRPKTAKVRTLPKKLPTTSTPKRTTQPVRKADRKDSFEDHVYQPKTNQYKGILKKPSLDLDLDLSETTITKVEDDLRIEDLELTQNTTAFMTDIEMETDDSVQISSKLRPVTHDGSNAARGDQASPRMFGRSNTSSPTGMSQKKTVTRLGKRTKLESTHANIEEIDNEDIELYEADTGTRSSSQMDVNQTIDITDDRGYDTDLENTEEPEAYDHTGKTAYVDACKRQGVIPVSYFLRHMHDPSLELKHHCLGSEGMKPIAVSLVSNCYITQLNLSDNWLGVSGGLSVCEMLRENCYITDIDLSDNKLSRQVAQSLLEVLNTNITIQKLNISGNDFDDSCAQCFADAIYNTSKLEYLDMSRNRFGEVAGVLFCPAISENSSLKYLDLSWNCIRRKGAVALAAGLKGNIALKKVNLSWNGFGNEGALALGDCLKVNSVLEELDISNNRILTEGAVLFGKGIAVNETLRILKMGKNPMQSAGCFALCTALLKNANSVMEEMDFTDVIVNPDFKDIFEKVKEVKPDIVIRHGGDETPKKPKARVHPMVKLKNYIDKNNLRLVDFFNKFDKDRSMSVTRAEFAEGITETGIKLTVQEVQLLCDELDKDGDGEINYSEMMISHTQFMANERGHLL